MPHRRDPRPHVPRRRPVPTRGAQRVSYQTIIGANHDCSTFSQSRKLRYCWVYNIRLTLALFCTPPGQHSAVCISPVVYGTNRSSVWHPILTWVETVAQSSSLCFLRNSPVRRRRRALPAPDAESGRRPGPSIPRPALRSEEEVAGLAAQTHAVGGRIPQMTMNTPNDDQRTMHFTDISLVVFDSAFNVSHLSFRQTSSITPYHKGSWFLEILCFIQKDGAVVLPRRPPGGHSGDHGSGVGGRAGVPDQ